MSNAIVNELRARVALKINLIRNIRYDEEGDIIPVFIDCTDLYESINDPILAKNVICEALLKLSILFRDIGIMVESFSERSNKNRKQYGFCVQNKGCNNLNLYYVQDRLRHKGNS